VKVCQKLEGADVKWRLAFPPSVPPSDSKSGRLVYKCDLSHDSRLIKQSR
jgi:hypothetical protein